MVCVQKWAEEWRKRTEDPDHMRALEALVRLLKNDVSPLDAAKEITAAYEISLKVPLPVPRKNTLYYNKVCDFWALYMSDAIRIFGSIGERERLCQLLTEISRQPDVLDDNGFPVKGYDRDGVYWSDLPAWHLMFGMHCLGKCSLHIHHEYLLMEQRQTFRTLKGTLIQKGNSISPVY